MDFVDLSKGKDDFNFGFSKFYELRPSERSVGLSKIWELADNGWKHEIHWKRPTTNLNPVGVYRVKDLIVTRPAGMIVNRLLGYNCNTAFVATQSMPIEENIFYMSPKNKMVIDEKVIIADGVSSHVFGHWIVDYLPRFAIAKDVLKEQFQKTKILLPSNTSGWVYNLLNVCCDVQLDNIIKYNPDHDIVLCKHAILPSYCYTQEFSFHSYLKEFYDSLSKLFLDVKPTRKLLISRSSAIESNRKFPLRDFFEQEALKRGFEIILPEKLSIMEQIKLFSEAKAVIGEYGSGVHNAVFSRRNTVIGCVGFWNAVQLNIGYLMGHKNIYLTKGCQWPTPENNEFILDCSQEDIISFLEKIDSTIPENPNEYNFGGLSSLFG